MDRERLEEIIRAHQAEIYRYLRYLGARSQEEAEDLVQDTFLGAYTAKNPPEGNDARLRAAWLRGIARNVFLNHCRRKNANPVLASEPALQEAEAVWTQAFLRGGDGFETVEALRKCLGELPPKSKRALDLFYGQASSRASLAQEFDLTEDGVKSLLRRLRSALGDCIERRLAAEGA